MALNNADRSQEQINRAIDMEETLPLASVRAPSMTGIIDNDDTPETIENQNITGGAGVERPGIDDQHTNKANPATPALGVRISRGQALIGMLFLAIVVFNAISAGNAGFIGAQGWAFVLGGSSSNNATNPLEAVKKKLQHPAPGASTTATPALTPAQYINEIIQNMTLAQKLGQMMIVQFVGPTYSLDISTMINQYNVGAVLLYSTNNNVI